MADKKPKKPEKQDAKAKPPTNKAQPPSNKAQPPMDKAQPTDKEAPVAGPGKAAKMPSRRNAYIAFIVLISAAILIWRHYIEPRYFAPASAPDGTQIQRVGAPKIGGPFNLIDQDGQSVSEADFKGQYMLIYFGYTYCPDICPTSLSAMADALDLLGDKAARITPVFITVDPERDDAPALKMYVEHFYPRLVGLTGSVDQIQAAAKAYKVYFAKVGDGYGDDDYAMEHSSITYLMGPDGEFISHFSNGVEAEPMARKLEEILK